MKNYLVMVALLLMSFGCAQPDPKTEQANAEAAIKGFYAAFEKFDYAAMRTFCTSDFHAIEGENFFSNLNDYFAMLKSFEGSTLQVQMDFMNADVVKDLAVVLFKFDVNMKKDKMEMNMKGYESHTLKKVNGKWLVSFYQCTYTNAPPKLEKGSLLGLHFYKDLGLKPGVTEAQAEDFIMNKYIPAYNALSEDTKAIPIKSLRGENKDKFAILFYFTSEDARNKYYDQNGNQTAKGQEMFKKLDGVQAESANFFISKGDVYNDWLVK